MRTPVKRHLIAASVAFYAATSALDVNAWYLDIQGTRGRVFGYRAVDIHGDGRLYRGDLKTEWKYTALEPYLGWIANYSRDNGAWESASWRADQEAGMNWVMENAHYLQPYITSVNSFSALLDVHYHTANVKGEFKEWWTTTSVRIDLVGEPMSVGPGYRVKTLVQDFNTQGVIIWYQE